MMDEALAASVTSPAPSTIGWRLYRDLGAEVVAEREGDFWVIAAVEDEGEMERNLERARAAWNLSPSQLNLIDANKVTGDEVHRVLQGSTILAGHVASTTSDEPLRRMIDLHFDVPRQIRSLKDRVNRYIFGYDLRVAAGRRSRSYRYRGVLGRPGARWIGQSVLRLPASIAEEVDSQLRSWGVPVTREEIYESY